MKEIPILFSTDMVQAILQGRKTQTRRLIKPQPKPDMELFGWKLPEYKEIAFGKNTKIDSLHKNRYGEKGDLLWVRETHSFFLDAIKYKADGIGVLKGWKWKPSIHMPKDYARIWLQVESVHAERLNDISQQDSIAEGIEDVRHKHNYNFQIFKDYYGTMDGFQHPPYSFRSLWKSINGDESWNQNPWVWVIKFKTLSTTGKPNLES